MLLVKTRLDKSESHGIGCFAAEDIKKGTKVWEFNTEVDRKYSESDLEKFPDSFSDIVRFYGFNEIEDGILYYIFCTDHAKHINHSSNPNLSPNYKENSDYATRDIDSGEELTCNYYEYYADPKSGLNQKI